jgi:DNA-directed RNA polymerase subunit H (RpoH/RPB5)|tara:strand:- start:101 stop:358 length:258 start_codon:yes stop_codon:yes gene_type:complete
MHILQPKHTKLNQQETEKLLDKMNISRAQLPKILSSDTALPEGCVVSDVIKIERREKSQIFTASSSKGSQSKEGDKINVYYRVVV